MRIGYFADGPWSHIALEKIINDNRFEVSFICARYSSPDNYLKKRANDLGIRFLVHKNVNSDEFTEKIKKYNCDVFLSMSFDQIFKNFFFNIPPLGTINIHAGKLPFYRGRNVLNWVLINDEKEFGVTVHYIDEGIDTGDIILQKKEKITDRDTYSTLLDRATKICAKLLYESIINILESKVSRVRQKDIDSKGSYYRKRVVGDEIVNWNWSSRKIFNFVRAISAPGPYAQTYFGQKCILISKASLINIDNDPGLLPGQVIAKKNNNLIVQTSDSCISIEVLNREEKNINIGTRLISLNK